MPVRDVSRALTITFFAWVVLAVGLQAASRWTLAFLVPAGCAQVATGVRRRECPARASAQAELGVALLGVPFPRVNAVLRILGGAFSVLAGIDLVLE